MTGYIVLFLVLIVGTTILAHYMGREVGREQEMTRLARRRYPCPQCRMLTDYASIPNIQERSGS